MGSYVGSWKRSCGPDQDARHIAIMKWPDWWVWELEMTPHLEKRMEDRDFTEVDLRAMLHRARNLCGDHMEGRFVVETMHRGKAWRVIVEPDDESSLLVVVTAYPAETGS
jgi:hypothetical protein